MDEESICGMWQFWSNCIKIEITLNSDKTANFWAWDEWEHYSEDGNANYEFDGCTIKFDKPWNIEMERSGDLTYANIADNKLVIPEWNKTLDKQ